MPRPEDRYVNLETKTLPDGRVVYKSARPKPVATDVNDMSIVAGDRDRMDIIAHNVYGEATDWWKIAAANGITNGSLHITPGMTVILPKE